MYVNKSNFHPQLCGRDNQCNKDSRVYTPKNNRTSNKRIQRAPACSQWCLASWQQVGYYGMRYNFKNDQLLRKKIAEFKKDKNALKFADWINNNVDSDFLNIEYKLKERKDG